MYFKIKTLVLIYQGFLLYLQKFSLWLALNIH